MKLQPQPQATGGNPGGLVQEDKKNSKEFDDLLLLVRSDMKVEILSAVVALVVGIIIFEITFITVLGNMTGWTLFWVGLPGLLVSLLLLFVVYILLKHRKNVEKLTDIVQNLNAKQQLR